MRNTVSDYPVNKLFKSGQYIFSPVHDLDYGVEEFRFILLFCVLLHLFIFASLSCVPVQFLAFSILFVFVHEEVEFMNLSLQIRWSCIPL